MAIANRAVSLISISIVVFSNTAKPFDLALEKQGKTKCKRFGLCLAERPSSTTRSTFFIRAVRH